MTTQQDDTSGGRLVSTTTYDPLGRVQSAVDGLGRQVQKAYRFGTAGTSYELSSNPYVSTGDGTMGWTLTTRALGTPGGANTVSVTTYDGAAFPAPWGGSTGNTNPTGTVVTTADITVSGNVPGCGGIATTVTDAANNTRTNCVDGLGRLSAVIEPTGMLTKYTHDTLDNLTGVSAQCLTGSAYTCSSSGSTGQTRTFIYSTLSRLTSASDPESGTITYAYYSNGNLNTRTDANGTVTTFGYDGLNRPTSISYAPGTGVATTPSVTYTYDQDFKGALSIVSSTASKTQFTHDAFGRIISSTQTTPNNGTPYIFSSYQYSLTDQLTSVTYPSGRKIAYTLDAADQVTSVNGTPSGGNATPYASNVTYTAAGDLSSLPFGNGITESHTWNSRFQHTGISAGNLLSLGYAYCPPNETWPCATKNTGTPWQHTIAIGGQTQAVQEYQHDSLNRLVMASEYAGSNTLWRAHSWRCPAENL